MAQYPIPQFIESEAKIISFLTFRQFFIIVGAGAICFLFYYILPFSLFAILSLIVAAIAGAIAFLKIDDVSIVTLIASLLTFSFASKNYVWKKKESPYPAAIKRYQKGVDPNIPAAANTLDATKKVVELRKKPNS